MGTRKIIPLRPGQPKGPVEPQKPLTLADITIYWGPDDRTKYVTGATVAKLIGAVSSKHKYIKGHDPLCGTLRMGPMLRGLGGWVFPDAGTPHEELESDMRFFLSELLSDMASEIEGEALSSEKASDIFSIHIGPPRKEWTK